MAVSLTRFSWWLWRGKEKEHGPPSNSSSEFSGFREPEFLRFKRADLSPSPSKKVKKKKKKPQSRNETRIDWEYDVVVVPSDGEMQMPDSADEADWSIGWFEPHGPDFQSDDSFAVLVPSYSHRCKELVEGSSSQLLTALKNLPNEFSSESKNSMEQWLSSQKNAGS